VAAWLLGRPLVVHEQNAVAGLTNRILARLASRVLEGFPGSFGRGVKAERVGNPVRPEITAIAPPERRYAGREGRARLLVFGGSQGAQRLNAVVPAALGELPESLRPDVLHQTGARGLEDTIHAYRSRGIEADVRPFIDDMAGAYGWADLAVCRSGALTVAELAAAGLPAVLVPFPAAVDDHQTRNAQFAVQKGAAVLLPESTLTPNSLATTLRELLEAGRPRFERMAHAARSTAITDADRRLADACMAVAKEAA
jgi:UDP-N-acetylglucosamine--N-acetylmuramyl-(pentapeptide) pyrophosphoryl-undecaprenol N-acetylglucosamine transferase